MVEPFLLPLYKLLHTFSNNIEVYEEPKQRTKKIPHYAVKFEAGQEKRIVYDSLYCMPSLQTLQVVKDDYTFATVDESGGGQPFGVAQYCGYHSGTNYYEWSELKIDLTGTGFALHDSVRVYPHRPSFLHELI